MTASKALSALIKPVSVLSETCAPAMRGHEVNVHYFEEGSYRRLTVNASRPTRFDHLVVASVYDTLLGPPAARAPSDSVRNILRNGWHWVQRVHEILSRPVSYSLPILDLRSIDPNNMAHLLLDIIPFALYVQSVVGPEAIILLGPAMEPFASLLAIFGIRPTQVNRRVRGHFLKLRGTRGLANFDLLSTFDCNGIHFVPEAYAGIRFSTDIGFERIFLARKPPRNLENQAELAEVTERYGYKTIFLEDYSLEEQMSIGAQAKHVVAVHGAAMSFLLFSKRIASVIELFPPNVHQEIFATCLGERVGRYDQVIPDFDYRVGHSGWPAVVYFKNRTFATHVPLVESLLSEIHRR